MDYLMLFSILLIILPMIFQFHYGRKAISKSINLSFGDVCLTSFVAQFILTFLSFTITSISLSNRGYKCVTPAVGIFGLSFFFTLILLLIIGIQLIVKITYKKND
ncbi:hypothetical protein [Flavobacterium sp. RS13.1]|uniref:hypothetical protein n=1 Tax=Flavobacterium sp. RS13.1 TaxID=3400345 RepID=UPI003AAF850D